MANPNNVIQLFPERPYPTLPSYFIPMLNRGRSLLLSPFDRTNQTSFVDRLKLEMPANNAKIGAQFVRKATNLKKAKRIELEVLGATRRESDSHAAQRARLIKQIDNLAVMKEFGYGMLTHAVLDVGAMADVPHDIAEQTVAYARAQGTEPVQLILPGRVTEDEALRATNFLEVYRTGR